MEIAIALLVAAALLAGAFAVLRDRLATPGRAGRRGERMARVTGGRPSPIGAGVCPLCRSPLGPGERVKSDISPSKGSVREDRLMRIFGCPHCWPPRPETTRVCPVCGRELTAESWVVARYFERPGRRHVHVLGCQECRAGRK